MRAVSPHSLSSKQMFFSSIHYIHAGKGTRARSRVASLSTRYTLLMHNDVFFNGAGEEDLPLLSKLLEPPPVYSSFDFEWDEEAAGAVLDGLDASEGDAAMGDDGTYFT